MHSDARFRPPGMRPGPGYNFRGRDYHHFTPREMTVWRGGRWYHGGRNGRFGWWWQVGGIWYYYAQPVYPYPTYVAPVVYVAPLPPAPPPPVAVGLPPPTYWYYCDNPAGYYPAVAACSGGWQPVPAHP
jgi:hypothetical protein